MQHAGMQLEENLQHVEYPRRTQSLSPFHIPDADLKPANIVLCGSRLDRRGFVAKLTDLGGCGMRALACTLGMRQAFGCSGASAPGLLC